MVGSPCIAGCTKPGRSKAAGAAAAAEQHGHRRLMGSLKQLKGLQRRSMSGLLQWEETELSLLHGSRWSHVAQQGALTIQRLMHGGQSL